MHITQTEVPIEQRKTPEQILIEMRQLVASENIDQHAIGELYNYTVVNRVAEDAGYTDAVEFFCENIKEISRATLVRHGAVAEEFTSEQAAVCGVTKLNLLLTYEEVTGTKADRAQLGAMKIDVPDENGVVTATAFADCTVDDMRKALQRLRKPTSSAPLPPESVARIQRFRDEFTRLFGKKNRIQVTGRNRKGKVILTLVEVPLDEAEAVGAVLMGNSPPPVSGLS